MKEKYYVYIYIYIVKITVEELRIVTVYQAVRSTVLYSKMRKTNLD
jgi:hypothetical protein